MFLLSIFIAFSVEKNAIKKVKQGPAGKISRYIEEKVGDKPWKVVTAGYSGVARSREVEITPKYFHKWYSVIMHVNFDLVSKWSLLTYSKQQF